MNQIYKNNIHMLAKKIRERRIKQKITVKELSIKANVSESTIYMLEHLKSIPKLQTIHKLIKSIEL